MGMPYGANKMKPIPNRRSPESIHPTEPLFSLLKVESDHEAEAFSVLCF